MAVGNARNNVGRVTSLRGIFCSQDFLGVEGTSLQWRFIASHLITRLSRDSLLDKPEVGSMPNTSGIYILSELFMVLGYFALNNPDNQVTHRFARYSTRAKTSKFERILHASPADLPPFLRIAQDICNFLNRVKTMKTFPTICFLKKYFPRKCIYFS